MSCKGRSDSACRRRGSQLKELSSPSWSEIRLSGTDALGFAQGQFSQLVTFDPSPSLLLAPDGHVIVGGDLWCEQEDVVFTVPTALLEVSVLRLRRFLLRVDVAISLREGVTGRYESSEELVAHRWPSEHEWALGLPPHSYGQWVVDAAVSFQKGCFTGQELVGRADARGATMPWRFVGGLTENLDTIDISLRAVGPEGPQGVTSYLLGEGICHWRGIAHRSWTNDAAGVVVEFMA